VIISCFIYRYNALCLFFFVFAEHGRGLEVGWKSDQACRSFAPRATNCAETVAELFRYVHASVGRGDLRLPGIVWPAYLLLLLLCPPNFTFYFF
jgi:hypothetical protein